MKKQTPIQKFSAGSVTASIWENKQKDFNTFNVTVERSYLDKDGKWHKTNSYRPQDLANLLIIIQESLKSIVLKKA